MNFLFVIIPLIVSIPSLIPNLIEAKRNNGHGNNNDRPRRHQHNANSGNSDLSLWIDEQFIKRISGFPMEIQIITDGNVQQYLLDPNFENYLPVIPSEVGMVNLTWRAGEKKYFYNFDRLQSFNEQVLTPPILSIETRGKIPRKPKSFSVLLPCSGKESGIALFTIGLLIETRKGHALQGTPFRFKLRKECIVREGPDQECDKKCANGGWCTKEKVCQCRQGYLGQYCQSAMCYPRCQNGGICSSPGVCDCPNGFHGDYCEGGLKSI
ncbi:Protein shifted [Folsomia candida]|uniref:Protein shifted n=1 Tax=Folsomia candida TaxID=158441 RepID=A0A226DCC4_FOLCA|nr:Protein shifted [Folsomia candida]